MLILQIYLDMLWKIVAKYNICVNCCGFPHFLFHLTLISFVGMNFQIFSSFFQVVGLSTLKKKLRNTQKKCDFLWLTMETFSGFIMKFSKSYSRKISIILSSWFFFVVVVVVVVFHVYFGEKMWLILYFSKFSR